jgi:DNA polymerase I
MFKEWRDFRQIWCRDDEYLARPGERVIPICSVAYELRSGRFMRQWYHGQGEPTRLVIKPDCLAVSYNCAAEFSCDLALGQDLPIHNLDACQEFKLCTNGLSRPDGIGLLGAMAHFGLNAISVVEKTEMRSLAMRGGPFTEQEKKDLIAYCQRDVEALVKLLGAMWNKINLPQGILRGRFLRAVAIAEYNGTPIDVDTLRKLRDNWEEIKLDLIAEVDQDFGCYEGTRFSLKRFAALLRRLGIRNWPKTEIGRLSKSDETMKKMAQAYPVLMPLRELNYTISKLRLERLAIGLDGRNRTSLWPFSTKTGRNAPKATEYIFGPSTWIRPLIKSREGYAIGSIDYASQEHGVAASLSGDEHMIEDHRSGDPYWGFAVSCGAIPQTVAKSEDPQVRAAYKPIRNVYKQCSLGILYGMQAQGLAVYSGQTLEAAEKILENHKLRYKRFWEWTDEVLERALLRGFIQTCYGWQFRAPWTPDKPDTKPTKKHHKGVPVRTIKNWPVQATAGEMFRLACCLIVERDVKLCAMVHDQVLIEAPVDEIEEAVAITREAMREASLAVLKGRLEIGTDYKIFYDRYSDDRGKSMWETVTRLLETVDQRRRIVPKPEQLGLGL